MYSVETTISRDSREGFFAFFFVNAGLCVIFFFCVCVETETLVPWCISAHKSSYASSFSPSIAARWNVTDVLKYLDEQPHKHRPRLGPSSKPSVYTWSQSWSCWGSNSPLLNSLKMRERPSGANAASNILSRSSGTSKTGQPCTKN